MFGMSVVAVLFLRESNNSTTLLPVPIILLPISLPKLMLSFSHFDEGLTLQTSALQTRYSSYNVTTLINFNSVNS